LIYLLFFLAISMNFSKKESKYPNIILFLADDLGYGDTSVEPFVGSGINTPELESLAVRGLRMTK